MSTSRTLTKVQTQGAPYNWIWSTRGTRSVAQKQLGQTFFVLEAADDTALLAKLNAHDGYRILDNGKPEHG